MNSMNCKRWAMSFMNWSTGLYDGQAVSLWSNFRRDETQRTQCSSQGFKMSLTPEIFLFTPGEWCIVHTRWVVHSSHQVSGAQFTPGEWCTVHTRWVVHSSAVTEGKRKNNWKVFYWFILYIPNLCKRDNWSYIDELLPYSLVKIR
jgi:hypothetical protein